MHRLLTYFSVFILSLPITHAQGQTGIPLWGKAKTSYYILNANLQVSYSGFVNGSTALQADWVWYA
jgi:hypothetical protein